MIRMIHISDLHVRSKPKREENGNAKKLAREILKRYGKDGNNKTIVIMTGDLVDDGKEEQYEQLERNVIKPLQQKFTVLAAPGNHDYAFWGNAFNKESLKHFRKYVRKIPKHPESCVDTIEIPNERKCLFIGVDSADPGDKAFFADGIVDKKQREVIKKILTANKYKDYYKVLYVHHHPFLRKWFVAFQQANEFLEMIRTKVDLVLFGHKHAHETFFYRYDVPTMLASGKVTDPAGDGDGLAFRVINLEKNGLPRIFTIEVPRS